jgi:hypothetical protein
VPDFELLPQQLPLLLALYEGVESVVALLGSKLDGMSAMIDRLEEETALQTLLSVLRSLQQVHLTLWRSAPRSLASSTSDIQRWLLFQTACYQYQSVPAPLVGHRD